MIEGELTALRAIGPSDADALWRWNHDPDVMRWMNEAERSLRSENRRYPQTPETVRAWLQDRPRESYGDVLFGIETRPDGVLVGLVRLHDTEPENGAAELDVYLGEKDHWGRGLATDALRTVCRYGFDRMRLHRIGLTVVAENAAARRVYAKVGFVEEGRRREAFRRAGRWHDMVVMGLLEGELPG